MHFLTYSFPGPITLCPKQIHSQHPYLLSCCHSAPACSTTYVYKSYNRAWNLFTAFLINYGINLHDLQEQHMLEFVSYLSLAELTPATIQLYFSGVRVHLCWHNLPSFKDSFVIKLILKGVSAKFREPDIRLPVT